jgi:glycosyltransferase 2 family protein
LLSRDGQILKSRPLHIVIGLVCAMLFLALSLHRSSFESVGTALTHANPVWLTAAIVMYAINLLLRAFRWQMILRPAAEIPYSAIARVLVAGYGMNNIMPARLGELFRADFLKNSAGLSRSAGLASIIVERLFDGFAVVGCLGLGLLLASWSRYPSHLLIELLIGGSLLFGTILAAVLWFGRLPLEAATARYPRLAEKFGAVQQGFAILQTRQSLTIAMLTVLVYVPDALTLWLIVKALGLGLAFSGTLVLVGVASLSTLLPSGPAFLGTLQFAYVLGIEFAGGQAALGIAAATLVQLGVYLPVSIIAGGILAHGSGAALYAAFTGRRNSEASAVSRVHS